MGNSSGLATKSLKKPRYDSDSFAVKRCGWRGILSLEFGYYESSQGCGAYGRVLAATDGNVEEQ
jgi:hypothetical protein